MGHHISESYSLPEIANLWQHGEIEYDCSSLHGYWRVREIEPFITEKTRRSDEDDLKSNMIDEGFHPDNPIVIDIHSDGTIEVFRDRDRLEFAIEIYGNALLVPVRFRFRK